MEPTLCSGNSSSLGTSFLHMHPILEALQDVKGDPWRNPGGTIEVDGTFPNTTLQFLPIARRGSPP
eukprot:4937356-Prorocentrum_lima.AAC.1